MFFVVILIAVVLLGMSAVIRLKMQDGSNDSKKIEQMPRVIVSQRVPGVFDAFKKNGQ